MRLARLKKSHAILKPFITKNNLDTIAQAIKDAGSYGTPVYNTFKYYLKSGLKCLEEQIAEEEKNLAGGLAIKKVLKIGKIYEIRQSTPKKYPKEEQGRIAVVQIRSFGKTSIGVNCLARNFNSSAIVGPVDSDDLCFTLIKYSGQGGWVYSPDCVADLIFKEIQTKDLPMYMSLQTTKHFDKILKGG